MIAPWDLHKIEVAERTKANFIKIRVRSEVFDAKRSYPSFVLKKIESNDFLIAMFHELLQNGFSEQYVYHIVNAIVLQIISRGETVGGLKRGEKYRLALEAAKIVHEDFSFSISESDVAKRISISPQYLSKIFK
jgi:YesN/AraC family two-component response regulator